MSEKKKRLTHNAEFKAKVALEALRGVKTLNEIGQEYGVHPQMVSTWKLELQQQAKTLFDVKRGKRRVEENASTERLYSEIGKLKMSLDWLQKKSGLNVVW